MVVQPLDSAENKLIRQIKRFATSHHARVKNQRTVVEGGRLIEEALGAGFRPHVVVYSPRWVAKPDGRALIQRLEAAGARPLYITDRLFDSLSALEAPPGVMAVVDLPPWRSLDEVLDPDPVPWIIVADAIQDPGNLGTLVRAALAAGARTVAVTPGTVEPFNPKTIRASAGAIFRLPVVRLADAWPSVLRQQGFRLYAAVVENGLPYGAVDWHVPLAIILGNEGNGLNLRTLAGAEPITIPMSPAANSLNVSMAGTVLAFHAAYVRQSKALPIFPPARWR